MNFSPFSAKWFVNDTHPGICQKIGVFVYHLTSLWTAEALSFYSLQRGRRYLTTSAMPPLITILIYHFPEPSVMDKDIPGGSCEPNCDEN